MDSVQRRVVGHGQHDFGGGSNDPVDPQGGEDDEDDTDG